jgi:hypothetical protein
VKGKKAMPFQLSPDSSFYNYGGYTPDLKRVFSNLNVSTTDSSGQGNWAHVYQDNISQLLKTILFPPG